MTDILALARDRALAAIHACQPIDAPKLTQEIVAEIKANVLADPELLDKALDSLYLVSVYHVVQQTIAKTRKPEAPMVARRRTAPQPIPMSRSIEQAQRLAHIANHRRFKSNWVEHLQPGVYKQLANLTRDELFTAAAVRQGRVDAERRIAIVFAQQAGKMPDDATVAAHFGHNWADQFSDIYDNLVAAETTSMGVLA